MDEKTTLSKFGQTFVSYGSYHYNPVNKIIHIVCIPIITATLLAALSYIPLRLDVYGHSLGCEHLFFAFSLLFYLFAVNVSAALIMAVLGVTGHCFWRQAFAGWDPETMRNTIIGLQIIGWVFQFIGHGVFQKRKPALLDNVSQIFSAPLFVFIELLDLVGLRTSEIEQCKKQIEVNVTEFRNRNKSQ